MNNANCLNDWKNMKHYRTGLVVGKFCPLHKGHELVIETALKQCEEVVVISYTSERYNKYSVDNRKEWLSDLAYRLTAECTIKIHVIDPNETNVPDDLASDEDHRKFCADYLLNVLETTTQAVFTSESYGQGFADYLTLYFTAAFPNPVVVEHILVDQERVKYPVSGTMIRNNNALIKEYCPNVVINSFVKKILFLGGESSGKTTISKQLADNFNTDTVMEFGIEFYKRHKRQNGIFRYEDMQYIAERQEKRITDMMAWANEYLFCDTAAITTMFYSKEWFGRVSKGLQKLVDDTINQYDKIYVCMPDFPMVQDGTRQDEAFRLKGFEFVMNYLEMAGIKYSLLGGTEEERLNRVIKDLK